MALHTYHRLEDARGLQEWEQTRRGMELWRVTESLYWLEIGREVLGHRLYYITCSKYGSLQGILPLAEVRGLPFGTFLISVPYVNWGGPWAWEYETRKALLDAAIVLAEKRSVQYLEIRGDIEKLDGRWTARRGHKVVMLRKLPGREEYLWQEMGCKVRNQIRKGMKMNMDVRVGGAELAGDFYRVYIHNMHYLGTPAYPRAFLRAILKYFADRSEIIVLRKARVSVAGALLLHGNGITEVPLAACLPEYRSSCANMLLYWELMRRAIERGSHWFDFGRCTPGSGNYQFKKQWGAEPLQLTWYYYIRRRGPESMAKEHPRFRRWQSLWKRLPLALAEWFGSYIIRGLPL
ncbi:MAG: FemAB family PEP-CTERM system-associated protein [Gemmatales bacterium]|nr:FemAB family PEP-CTERM system-associated protein [Gemmatales bacterium]MDW8174194.1 FemAB family PEP-CTERM system-associated protein [Gemmatales bacterium]MDW8221853.1 FemAB family PEP-CTERM system-associated protein [Gemmatales bacterium]